MDSSAGAGTLGAGAGFPFSPDDAHCPQMIPQMMPTSEEPKSLHISESDSV